MPTNTSAASATLITSLPYTETFTPTGPTVSGWWQVSPETCDEVLGVRPWTADASYLPKVRLWQGDPASLTAIADGTVYTGVEPIYFPVTPGIAAFIQIEDNTTGTAAGTMTLTVDRAPTRPISAGDLVIQDDAEFYPAVVRSRADGSVLRYLPVIAGEEGASAGDSMLASDSFSARTVLYDRTGTKPLASYAIGPVNAITQNRAQTYYVADGTDFYKIDHGALTTMPYSLPFANISGLAVDDAANKLYYTRSPTSGAIRSLTLSTGAGDAELIPAAGAGTVTAADLLRLGDGSLIVGYTTGSVNTLKRFTSAGVLVQTLDLGTDEIYHLTHDIHPLQFWVWSYPLASGEDGRFRLLDLSLTTLISWDRPTFRFGQANGTGTATFPIFGHSQSCTFWVIPSTPEDCGILACDCACDCASVVPGSGLVPPGPSGTAVGDDPTRELAFYDVECLFGGTVPTGTNGVDVENWAD